MALINNYFWSACAHWTVRSARVWGFASFLQVGSEYDLWRKNVITERIKFHVEMSH